MNGKMQPFPFITITSFFLQLLAWAVAALLAYIADRGAKKGPLFMFEDGRFLTSQHLVDRVRAALRSAETLRNIVGTALGSAQQHQQQSRQ